MFEGRLKYMSLYVTIDLFIFAVTIQLNGSLLFLKSFCSRVSEVRLLRGSASTRFIDSKCGNELKI